MLSSSCRKGQQFLLRSSIIGTNHPSSLSSLRASVPHTAISSIRRTTTTTTKDEPKRSVTQKKKIPPNQLSTPMVLPSDTCHFVLPRWTNNNNNNNNNKYARLYFSSKQPSSHTNHNNNNNNNKEEKSMEEGLIPKVIPMEWRLSDLASVWGISILFITVLITPMMFQKMKQSDRNYEMDSDDALRHDMFDVANDLRGNIIPNELLSILTNNNNNNNNNLSNKSSRNDDGAYNDEDEDDDEDDLTNKAVRNTVAVVSDILNSDALQRAISSLLTRVIESKQFQSACQQLVRKLWNDLVNDPETLQQIVHLLNNAIQNPELRKSVHQLILELINDEQIYQELTALLIRLGEDPEVGDATKALLTESAHRALNDPEILDHSMEFATDVVGDDVVQRTSGEALRNTVSYAVKPGLSAFLGVLGMGLLLFSYSALRNARSLSLSEKSEEYIIPIISSLSSNIGTPIVQSLTKILRMPGQILSKIGSVLYKMLVRSPFQWIKYGSMKITRPITKVIQSGKNALSISLIGVTVRKCKDSIIWMTTFVTTTSSTIGKIFSVITHRIILSTSYLVQISKKPGMFISKYIIAIFKRKGGNNDDSNESGPNNDLMPI